MFKFLAGVLLALTLTAVSDCSYARAPLTFEERVNAQESIERVYYNHRIWPKENKRPKPPFEQMVPRALIEAKINAYLEKCYALDRIWNRPIQPQQLQSEMERMALRSRDSAMLRELFAALVNDPYLVAECLARPALAERLVLNWSSGGCEEIGSDLISNLGTLGGLSIQKDSPTGYNLPEVTEFGACNEGWSNGSLDDQADPREMHSAIWTGSELIVWGGRIFRHSTAQLLNSGGRYNPATDTWTPTSTGENCPSPGTGSTAVWTGNEMIVWGGKNYWSGGGRYSPVSDSWTPVSRGPNKPVERWGHSAVWTGVEMIVWGGEALDCTEDCALNTGGRYNPATDTWTPTSTGAGCPSERASHTAVWTGSEMLVWGGSDYGLSTGGRYSPRTDTWLPISSGQNCPTGRTMHTAVWTGSEMIVWGGRTAGWATINTGGRYNPDTDSWSATQVEGDCPAPRTSHSAIWTGSEMIVWGGDRYRHNHSDKYNDGGRYNPLTDNWVPTSTGPNCPSERDYHTAVWTGNEMIVWGGATMAEGTWECLRSGGRYSPATDTWVATSTGAPAPAPRSGHSAIWTGVEVIVWGGEKDTDNVGWRYLPSSDAWTTISDGEGCPSARSGHNAIWTGSEMIIWGGLGNVPNIFYESTGGKYEPASDNWKPTSTGANCPSARSGAASAWTGREMLIWGGIDGSSLLNSGAKYVPEADTWTRVNDGAGCPGKRVGFSSVWTGKELIVWGGSDGSYTYFGNGSRYDPTEDTWEEVPQAYNSPSNRANATSVWTGNEMVIWGGLSQSSPEPKLNSGGRYNPSTGSWLATSIGENCPSVRVGNVAEWTGSEMFIWGGSTNEPSARLYSPLTDTWRVAAGGSGGLTPRSGATSIWTGSDVIAWGGNAGQMDLNSGGAYSPGGVHPKIYGPSDGCKGKTVSLSTDAFTNYQWSLDGSDLPGATARVCDIFKSGVYAVRVSDGTGCQGMSENWPVDLHEDPPEPAISGPVSGCDYTGVNLRTGLYSTYQWMKDGADMAGETSRQVTARQSGFYRVRVTDLCGQAGSSDGLQVSLAQGPVPTVTGPDRACGSAELSTGKFVSYQWKKGGVDIKGATGRQYLADESGTYSVLVGDDKGCVGLSTGKEVTIDPVPALEITGSAETCPQAPFVITVMSFEDVFTERFEGAWPPSAGGEQWKVTDLSQMGSGVWSRNDTLDQPNMLDPSFGYCAALPESSLEHPIRMTELITPRFDLLADVQGAKLSFDSNFRDPASLGGATLEVSEDGGNSWKVLVELRGDEPRLGDGEKGYVTKIVNLKEYAGKRIKFRWYFSSFSNWDGKSWMIDNVVLSTLGVAGISSYQWLKDGTEIPGATGTSLTVNEAGEYSARVQGGNGCGALSQVYIYGPAGLPQTAAEDVDPCTNSGVRISWVEPANWNDGNSGARYFEVLRDGVEISQRLQPTEHEYVDWDSEVGQDYFYAIKVTNGCGASSVSKGVHASNNSYQRLSCAVGPEPPDTGSADESVTLTWSAVEGSTSYDVYLGKESPPPLAGNSATNSYTPGRLDRGATYYWKVVPKNPCHISDGCEVWDFSVWQSSVPGDCDGDGSVSIGEVQKAINMFLGTLVPGCGVDCNGNGQVSIGELQKVINAFLGLPANC